MIKLELEGKVKSGFGVGAKYIEMMNKAFKEKYGIMLYPGTLNIEVEEPFILESEERILKNEYNGNQDVIIKKVKFFNKEVYIVRPELNNKTDGEQPVNVIEIVSDINLRQEYDLKDGDKCKISF